MGWRQTRALPALAILAATAGLLGCGDSGSASPPFTASDSQVRSECLIGTYLPEEAAQKTEGRPPPEDWSKVEDAPGALQPDRAVVQVTLRPEQSGEEIVLTGVRFDVVQHSLRPAGTVFHRRCRREVVGPAVEADLDGNTPEIGDSSAALNGRIGPGLQVPPARPIRFPWTVSLDKPLRLYLLVHAEHSYASWGARISWESESSEGTIRVDNEGRRYEIADTVALPWLEPGPGGRWVEAQPPRYTNAE